MSIDQILFWLLSTMTLVSAVMVITRRNPIFCILWLVVTFISISGHYILLNAQFLAVVNFIVYAGAIMVLFLFVIMLMNLNLSLKLPRNNLMQLAGVLAGGSLLLVLIAALKDTDMSTRMVEMGAGNIGLVENLGQVLFKKYVLPFELSSVLFLSSMVGAVVLSKKEKELNDLT